MEETTNMKNRRKKILQVSSGMVILRKGCPEFNGAPAQVNTKAANWLLWSSVLLSLRREVD